MENPSSSKTMSYTTIYDDKKSNEDKTVQIIDSFSIRWKYDYIFMEIEEGNIEKEIILSYHKNNENVNKEAIISK